MTIDPMAGTSSAPGARLVRGRRPGGAGVVSWTRPARAAGLAGAAALIGAVLASGLHGATAATGRSFRIVPGPAGITAEEKALAPDPARGMQHALILVDETLRDDSPLGSVLYSYHMRARVFSQEARGLADVELPFTTDTGRLVKWWGRTLLPDGTVLELKQEELKQQEVVRLGSRRERVLRAALPGVTPGCVVDYGYVFEGRYLDWWTWIPLQYAWPVKQFRYRWVVDPYTLSQYHVRRRPGLDLKVTREKGAIVLEGRDLPLFVDEPWMPPEDIVRAGAVLFYLESIPAEDPNVFWAEAARRQEERVTEFLAEDDLLEKTLAGMGVPPEAGLEENLRQVYDWIDANIKDRGSMTSEEAEEVQAADEARQQKERKSAYAHHRKWNSVEDLLKYKEGYDRHLDYLFIGFARKLGADAHLVMAPDRRVRYWDPSLMSLGQLPGTLVAVRPRGASLESATVVDPGSGLPYGTIPWANTAIKGLAVTPKGAREILLKHGSARDNLLGTQARIAFDPEGAAALVKWSETGTGQRGAGSRAMLRGSTPEERRERLEELCGAGGDFEIETAEAPGLEQAGASFSIACEGRIANLALDAGRQEFSFVAGGAWIPPLPDFPAPSRVHPIVFDHPWMDISTIEVSAPPGFAPAEPPPPVTVVVPFGSYTLTARPIKDGFLIKREFVMEALTLKPEAYDQLRRFLEEARRADRAPVVFRRGDQS